MDNQLPSNPSRRPVNSRPRRLPPIRILDILVLTTAMAVVFMIQEKLSRIQGAAGLVPDANRMLRFGIQMLRAIPTGIAFASIYWLIEQKRTTGKFFLQPGHWILPTRILAYIGTLLFTWFLYGEIAGAVSNVYPNELNRITKLFGGMAAFEFVGFILLMVATLYHSGVWRWFLGLLAISYLASACFYFLTMWQLKSIVTGVGTSLGWLPFLQSHLWIASSIFACTLAFVLVIAVLSDRRNRISRDWLHWAALVVILFEFVVTPVITLVAQYFGPPP